MSIVKRAFAFIVDWVIICSISIAFFLMSPEFSIDYLLYPSIKMFSFYGIILGILSFTILPLIKDLVFCNASIGKAIFGLCIVDAINGSVPAKGKVILRNLMFYFPFIEIIPLLIIKKTLGDIISGTEVVKKYRKD